MRSATSARSLVGGTSLQPRTQPWPEGLRTRSDASTPGLGGSAPSLGALQLAQSRTSGNALAYGSGGAVTLGGRRAPELGLRGRAGVVRPWGI